MRGLEKIYGEGTNIHTHIHTHTSIPGRLKIRRKKNRQDEKTAGIVIFYFWG